MTKMFEVNLQLTDDGPDCMDFDDTYQGLENIWYQVRVGDHGGVSILANPDGFEHLARIFLKLARTEKSAGYHSHHPLGSSCNSAVSRVDLGIASAYS